MNKILRRQVLIYVMYEEFGMTQEEIASVLSIAQSTVSHAVKKIDSLLKYQNFDKELQETRAYLQKNGLKPFKFTLNFQNYNVRSDKNE